MTRTPTTPPMLQADEATDDVEVPVDTRRPRSARADTRETTDGGTGRREPDSGRDLASRPREEPDAGSGRTPRPRRQRPHRGRTAELDTALRELHGVLKAARFGLPLPDADLVGLRCRALAGQIDGYLLPRLAAPDAPLLTVVAGSTGAGKSTLVNSLVEMPVSPAGAPRPNTRAPVLVCHPDDLPWFVESGVLPGLARTDGPVHGRHLQVVPTPQVPAGVGFLDAPDIDSVVDANRELAAEVMAAADLWLFVTTATRYADTAVWTVLAEAADRRAGVALVFNRVPRTGRDVVVGHLRHMLSDNGLADAPMFVVDEQPLDEQGLLPADTVAPLRTWFASFTGTAKRRESVARQALSGAVAAVGPLVEEIADHLVAQRDATASLRASAQQAYAEALAEVEQGVADGALLHGEVLARWHELVAKGHVARAVQARTGGAFEQVRAAMTSRVAPGEQFQAALASGITALVTCAATDAAEQVGTRWAAQPAGLGLLAGRDLALKLSAELPDKVEALVTDWRQGIADQARLEVGRRRTVGRVTSYLVNATSLLAMAGVVMPVGADTGFGYGGAAARHLVRGVHDDPAVRQLAAHARQDLLDRVRVLLDDERQRYTSLLHRAHLDPAVAERLRDAAAELGGARTAAGLTRRRNPLAAIPVPDDTDTAKETGDPDPVGGAEDTSGTDDAGHTSDAEHTSDTNDPAEAADPDEPTDREDHAAPKETTDPDEAAAHDNAESPDESGATPKSNKASKQDTNSKPNSASQPDKASEQDDAERDGAKPADARGTPRRASGASKPRPRRSGGKRTSAKKSSERKP